MKRALFIAIVLLVLATVAYWIWTPNAPGLPAVVPDTRAAVEAHDTEPETVVAANPSEADVRTSTRAVDQATSVAEAPVTSLRVRTISKESGVPLEGVMVHALSVTDRTTPLRLLSSSRGKLGDRLLTADDGWAEFQATPETTLHVSAGGIGSGTGFTELDVEPLAVGEARAITLDLRAEMDLVFHARVIEAESRSPVAGATVQIRSGATPAAMRRTETTDADGRFVVSVQSWNHAALTVEPERHAQVWILPTAGHETRESAFEIVLTRPATLRVRIVDASGQPIEAVSVHAKVPRYQLMQPEDQGMSYPGSFEDDSFRAKTDASGTATLANLPARVSLHLSASRLRETLREEAQPLVLQPGEERELVWRVGAGARVFGVVTEADGKPSPAQEMWLQPAVGTMPVFLERFSNQGRRIAKCDQDGTYEFVDVPGGSWLVGPADPRGQNGEWSDGFAVALAQVVAIGSESAEQRVDFQLTRDLTIRGRVENPEGAPLGNIGVECRHVDSHAWKLTRSKPDGSFVLGPLVEASYSVRAGAMDGSAIAPLACSAEVVVAGGTRDLVLRMQLGATLAGQVIDASTLEPVAAELLLVPIKNVEAVPWGMTMPSAQRESGFAIGGLPPATYSLAARTMNGAVGYVSSIELAPGEAKTDVELRVKPGATVEIFYDGALPFGSVQLIFDGTIIAADGVQKGTRRSFSVPSGRSVARMHLRGTETPIETSVEVALGETKELRFVDAWK